MSITRGAKPWIAGLTVLAVAVVAGLAGHWIVQRGDSDAPDDVRTLPVLAPIGYGPAAPPAEGQDGSLVRSPVQDTRDVPFVDGEPQVHSEVVDAIVGAPDPGALIDVNELAGEGEDGVPIDDPAETDAGVGDSESSADDGRALFMPHLDWTDLSRFLDRDDPCAPEDAESADDCPEGVGGTIGPWLLGEDAPLPQPDEDRAGDDGPTGSDGGVGARRSDLVETPMIPPTSIRGLTPDTMLLSAAHRSDVTIDFNVQILETGEQPDCGQPGDDLPLANQGTSSGTRTVDESWLSDRHYDTAYTKRSTIVVMVPAGSRILGCIAERDGDRASWDWFEAQRRTWRVLESPDVFRPSISVDSVQLRGELEPDSVNVSVRWPNARAYCELLEGPSVAGNTMAPEDHDAVCSGDEFGITGGDATISTYVEYDGTSTSAHSVLPLASLGCPECLIPPTAHYSIPLTIETGPVEMCGSGLQAPCDPLKAVEAVGTVRLTVDWEASSAQEADWGSRQTRWAGTEYVSEDLESELDPLPQIEMINEQARFETVDPTDSERGYVNASYTLVVDRPVHYDLRLDGDCWVGDSDQSSSGNISDRVELQFDQLCFDSHYLMSITLTDQAGATVTYDSSDWIYGGFTTPKLQRAFDIDYEVRVEDQEPNDAYLLESVVLHIGDRTLDVTPPVGERCFFTAVYELEDIVTTTARIGHMTPVTFEVDLVPTDSEGGVCQSPPYDYYRPVTQTTRISMGMWPHHGTTVTVESPLNPTSRVDTSAKFWLTARPSIVDSVVDDGPNTAQRR